MPQPDLITEACVRRMAPGAELRLGRDRIATPAALDLAFARGVVVRYADEECTASAPTGGKSDCGCDKTCLWSRIKARPGTYVVDVRGGRALVTRLGEAGPERFGEE